MCYNALRDAEDDPLPAVESLQILGKATPGHELYACGYCINGTTTCKFSWFRGSEDGSMNYIQGADQPTYEVTEDDLNLYLAIEVMPIDSRGRKGEMVRVFANDERKISHGPCPQEKPTSQFWITDIVVVDDDDDA